MAYVKTQTERVTLPSDSAYWVDIKSGLTYGELKDFNEYGGDSGPLTTSKKLALIVTDWNLDDADGNKLPLVQDSFDLLQEADVIAIVEAYNAKEVSDDAKKNFPKQSSPTSTAKQ